MNKDIIIKVATESKISKYFSLEEIGIDNCAFPYEQAIMLVDMLRQSCVPILGGDVYLKIGSTIEITYDNWYCDKSVNESDGDFLKRSCDEAKCFISSYTEQKNAETLFSFVLTTSKGRFF
jgi:hypothetical protein